MVKTFLRGFLKEDLKGLKVLVVI